MIDPLLELVIIGTQRSKTIGDAGKPATVLAATHQGFRAGLSIS